MSALKSVVVREQIVSTLREVSNVNVAKAITVLAQYAQRVSVMMPSVQQTRSASRLTKLAGLFNSTRNKVLYSDMLE